MNKLLVLLSFAIITSPLAAEVDSAPLRALTISAAEFQPTDSSVVVNGTEFRRSAAANGDFLVAAVHLPDGAEIVEWELNYCRNDSSAGNVQMRFEEECENDDPECWVQSMGSAVQSDGTVIGCAKDTAAPGGMRPIDNAIREYLVVAGFTSQLPDQPVGNAYIKNFRIFYRMVTAPAPAVPTFGDVPNNHVFYQAIEALAASGVTNGCAPNQFCPERPVTRGEIAAFLARALGLGWKKP